MEVLHICPANVTTGGTEDIHQLINEMRKYIDARILYVGDNLSNPQPEEYKIYDCPFVTKLPEDFKGTLIFPEIMADDVVNYKQFRTIVNWQGVDVYYWSSHKIKNAFLQNKQTQHITTMQYGIEHLKSLGLKAFKIEDCINDDFFQEYTEEKRNDIVLYNPTQIKLTQFQKIVMQKCRTELGIRFQPLSGYTRTELIDVLRHAKLYIDFGVFSGRERLPREAALCGCCVLTSTMGAAQYFEDVPIPDEYKMYDINMAVDAIHYILANYNKCRSDFDYFRQSLKDDKVRYKEQVKEFCNVFFNNNPGI